MTRPMSIRFDPELLARLRARASSAGGTPSGLAQELIDEGLRVREHPGIVFRDGPSGRRAALVVGPDVWEVVSVIRRSGAKSEKRAVTTAANELDLSPAQVQVALGYYGSHSAEIDAQVETNERVASEALASWEARQRLLA